MAVSDMYIHDATEEAYKNGYEKGKKEGAMEIIQEIAKGCTLKTDDCWNTEFNLGYLSAMNDVLLSLRKLKSGLSQNVGQSKNLMEQGKEEISTEDSNNENQSKT